MSALISNEDFGTLAQLHRRLLPTSNTALLGERYARTFWRFAAASPLERVVIERDGQDGIVGAAMLSLAPETLSRRLLLGTPLVLHAWKILPRLFGRGRATPISPEMLFIFTAEAVRGKGVGRRLLTAVEAEAAAAGCRELYVHTFADPQHPSARFYQALGYAAVGTVPGYGMAFLRYRKALA